MKKYYSLFIVFCLLSLVVTVWNMAVPADTCAYFLGSGVIRILVWCSLLLIAVKETLAVPKPERKWQHYLFPVLAFLLVVLSVADTIRRVADFV